MTVPLLRRRGMSMTQSAAMAKHIDIPFSINGNTHLYLIVFHYPVRG